MVLDPHRSAFPPAAVHCRRCWHTAAVTVGVAVAAMAGIERPAHGAEQPWPFLPVADVGALRFRAQHPEYDGRGVVLAVLDSGVDMGIPGLERTSDGRVKVIGARDFTGQGTIALRAASWVDGRSPRALQAGEGVVLEGADALAVPPIDSLRIWTGVLDEQQLRNAGGTQDINDDGDTNDRFGLVVYEAVREAATAVLGEGQGAQERRAWGPQAAATEQRLANRPRIWLCIFDRDADGHLDDEPILRDYPVNYDTIDLRDAASRDARRVLTLALDLREEDNGEPSLRLHFDDGGHGSHVAGIAAGFRVHGQDGLHGVAPGVRLLSCKLGDTRLAGGSTRSESMRRAFEHVEQFQRDYDVPVVVNMSYGIGSEIEGDAAMEGFLDDLLDRSSKLVIVTSAGNLGPGISSVGTPGAADGIIACAALASREATASLFGGGLVRDELYAFSSRGGELAKPDVAAPGGASSTVPMWNSDADVKNGTSMASPQTAGGVACMLSGLSVERRGWSFGTIKRALQSTARPLPGYTRLDVGAGVVDLPAAFAVARAYADAGEPERVTLYRVRTQCPQQPDGKAPAAYWRSGGYVPTAPLTQDFTVAPRFASTMSRDERNRFYRAFELQSDAPWIRADRAQTYLSGEDEALVRLSYDPRALREPGVYVGTVIARAKATGRSGPAAYEFALQTTVVRPWEFDRAGGYERQWDGQLTPAESRRYFVRVPPGASSMEVEIEVPDGKQGQVRAAVHDPQGRGVASVGWAGPREPRKVARTFTADELQPGTWEIVAVTPFAPAITSAYRLRVRFDGLAAEPVVLTSLQAKAPGSPPSGRVTVTPLFDQPFRGAAQGTLDRFRRERTVEMSETDTWRYPFEVDASIASVRFDLELPAADYNAMTDLPVNILDEAGTFVANAGLDQRKGSIELASPAPGRYTLEVVGALALGDERGAWSFRLIEQFVLRSSLELRAMLREQERVELFPDSPAELEVAAAGAIPQPPAGFQNAGELRLVDERSGRVRLTIPVRLAQ